VNQRRSFSQTHDAAEQIPHRSASASLSVGIRDDTSFLVESSVANQPNDFAADFR